MFDKYQKIEFRKYMLGLALFVSFLMVHLLGFNPFGLVYYALDINSSLVFHALLKNNSPATKILIALKADLIILNTILFSIIFMSFLQKPYKIIVDLLLSNKETLKHIRGGQKIEEIELEKRLKKDFKEIFKKQLDKYLIFINSDKSVFLPFSFENRGTLIIGSPGSGKSVLLRNLILQIITRDVVKQKVIIYDRKPEFVQNFKTKNAIIFYPKEKNTIKWDFGNEIRGREDIRFMVDALIPLREDEKQPIFPKAARLIIESILLHLLEQEKCSNKGMIDFLREFGSPGKMKLELQATLEKYGLNLDPFLQNDGQFSSSIMGTVLVDLQSSFCIEEFYHEEGEAEFSIKKYLEDDNDNRTLFILNPSATENFYGAFYTLFMSFLSRNVRSLSNDTARRIWIFLDEFQTLKSLNNRGLTSILSLLAEGRQKGASIVLATQSLGQIKKLYEETGMATIFNTTTTKIFLNNQEPSEQKYIAEFIGSQEVAEFNTSKNLKDDEYNSLTRAVKEKKVIIPSELSNLNITENKDGSLEFECFIKLGHYPTSKIKYKTQNFKDIYVLNEIEIKRGFKKLEKKDELFVEEKEEKKNNIDSVDYNIIDM
ncbi:MAG: type IV secretion system DNA-binding domain-containing protein [Arcobacteraceae bacterium]